MSDESVSLKTILIVDDVPENAQVLSAILGGGYRVKVATRGDTALKIAAADPPPDLILLDVMMPEMDGYEVIRRLKADAKTSAIPVLFISALEDEADESKGFELGAVDYLTKPPKPAVVLQRVRLHLELMESRVHLERLGAQYSSYLAPELARGIQSGEIRTDVGSRRKKLSIFFSDIQGFTRQSEKLEPEDLNWLLNTYFEAMNGVIARHGGTLDKYIGDAILVFFGDPHSRGLAEDAHACVRMALEMQRAVEGLQDGWRKQGIPDPLRVRMGVATGFCTVGNFGSKHKLDYTIIGSPVNLAARLQSAARPGSLLVSEETWHLVADGFDGEALAPLPMKGFAESVPTWEILGAKGAARGGDASRPELERLAAGLDAMDAGEKARLRASLKSLLDRLETP